jgi:predicted methyltransferase
MADSADTAVRAVSFAITRPVQKVSGFAAGVTHGIATLKARHNVGEAVQSAREAAARRERDLEEELRAAGGDTT